MGPLHCLPTLRTNTDLNRRVRVHYPVTDGRLVLRTDLDWDRNLEAVSVSAGKTVHEFDLATRKPFVYLKACWLRASEALWSVGTNVLVLMTSEAPCDIYPFFRGPDQPEFTPLMEVESRLMDRNHLLRVMVPPGYHDNPLKRYPVLYMQDGQNLFFPEEAFLSHEWRVDESLHLLSAMNATDKVIVVGLYSEDRMRDYTRPGYEVYGRSVVKEVMPQVNSRLRTLTGTKETGVMGSSLGGVVSFYMGWEYPDVFGFAACLSSTFSYEDNLIDRVLREEWRPTKFYLDSGWPGDNYEVTLSMAMALHARNFALRQDFVHFVFPLAVHDESYWAERLHLPLQLFGGKLSLAARGRME